MGRVFHEKAIIKGGEQGFNKFETIVLLAQRARQKQKAVQGIKYLSPEQQAWCKEQSKFPIQALKELNSDELNLLEFYKSLIEPIEEDIEPKPVEDKPKE